MALPAMIADAKSRVNAEYWIYYNLGVGKITYTKFHNGSSAVSLARTECGGGGAAPTCPGSSWNCNITAVPCGGASGDIPANAQPGLAVEAEVDPTAAGDIFYQACLPPVANDVFLCMDQGFSATPAPTIRPVAIKYSNLDHYVRQRPDENSLSISEFHVGNRSGLQRIAGRYVTLIVKISPSGTGTFSEIQYYCGVLLNMQSANSEADANENASTSHDASFDFHGIFTPA